MSGRISSPRIPPDFALKEEWPWIKAIGYSLRVTQHADGNETDETRYYILSRYLSGKRFSEAVRGHWGIESMHWVLDVNFREDDSRTRERTLGQQLELAETLRRQASEASSRQGQPPRQDDAVHDEHGLPHGSPDYSRRLICAGRGHAGERHILVRGAETSIMALKTHHKRSNM